MLRKSANYKILKFKLKECGWKVKTERLYYEVGVNEMRWLNLVDKLVKAYNVVCIQPEFMASFLIGELIIS